MMYGSGLRVSEALGLRVKDVDFAHGELQIRDSKGGESRITILPDSVRESLVDHLHYVKFLHQQDLEKGYGAVNLPFALERKYPNAEREWIWQFVFPSDRLTEDPRTGKSCRYHIHESGLQRAVKESVQKTGITKQVSCHTFRHKKIPHPQAGDLSLNQRLR
jgi:integrase